MPLLLAKGGHADPYTAARLSGPKSSLRLIAAPSGPPGSGYRAGVEINLDPGALTYWRTPGGAGAAPEFSFDGSANVAAITVSYPAPERIVEDGIEAFGYRSHVIFPLRIEPKDPARPVRLALAVSYAVCARLCLPAKGDAKLTFVPGQAGAVADSLDAAALRQADALVPIRLPARERDAKITLVRAAGARLPTWRLSAHGGKALDLFAEAPRGWYFDTRPAGRPNEFLIVEAERPQGGSPRPEVILTVKDEQQSYEFSLDLDAASQPAANANAAPFSTSQPDKVSE
ncbi:MAG: hypothetical protein J2P49_04035 [Methylocapsa sp.]|nr:hypothetical protein [Methylocapsa sp.]